MKEHTNGTAAGRINGAASCGKAESTTGQGSGPAMTETDGKERVLGPEEIQRILPHRAPMLLLDEVRFSDGGAYGAYMVRGDEWFLQGHFPDHPVVPGVILCEILAQSACVLLQQEMEEGALPLYTGLDRVRFKSPVYPGDRIETVCHLERIRKPFYFAKGTVRVENRLCVTADFSFAVQKSTFPADD